MSGLPRRIFGIETEYGLTYAGARPIIPDELARQLFKQVVAWGRSTNVFLPNAARLYLDVGSHPEYATAECATIDDLIAQDRAGDRILTGLASETQQRLDADFGPGKIHLFKNNVDSHGNSYGCHENYLLRRRGDFSRLTSTLVPFFISRQILVGAGHLHKSLTGEVQYAFSQRAEHIWDSLSGATTRSRPIINTRDEPHANPEKYRRLHVIVGDTSMAEPTMMLKVGMTHLVLTMIEQGHRFKHINLAEPMKAIRAMNLDMTGRQTFELVEGPAMSALDIQTYFFEQASEFFFGSTDQDVTRVLDLWQRGLQAVASGDWSGINTELDWAIKHRMLQRYREKSGATWDDARLARLNLAYHDINPVQGVFHRMQDRGQIARVVTDTDITRAQGQGPANTRGHLRSKFIQAVAGTGVEYAVDWVQLKITGELGRSVSLPDPFQTENSEVEELLEVIANAV